MKKRGLDRRNRPDQGHDEPAGGPNLASNRGKPLLIKPLFIVAAQCLALVWALALDPGLARAGEEAEPASGSTKAADSLLELGVEKRFTDFERSLIKDQIRTFIPPLLRGFTPLHAFVLPPNTFEVALSTRFADIDGDDFFSDGKQNRGVFGDSRVERQFTDLSIFYGFDFQRKYLHSFTAFLNIPYLSSRVSGAIHPNGIGLIDVMNLGSTEELGDVSLIIKKKLIDQANFPVGLAVAAGAFFPTGANDEKFGADDGRVSVQRPTPPDGSAPPVGIPLPIPMLQGLPLKVGPFPFNGGVFDRFSDDGRLPSVLQPGDGDFSFVLGGFLTRQFLPGDLPLFDRAALHAGVLHRFRLKEDGIDRGDINTHQLTFVAPIWKDYLAAEVGYLGFYQFADHYDGTFITPFFTDSAGNNVSSGATHVTFKEVSRPSFTKGEWGNIATSLIFSPDPQIRLVATVLTRVVEPTLGPAPSHVFRLSLGVLF